MTIYQQIGGAGAVNAAVDLFYEKVLADPTLTPYFDTIDMSRLKAHQRAFLAAALGGAETYQGKPMATAHEGLGITAEAFDAVVGHLGSTLSDLDVPDDVIGQIAAKLLPLKGEIVSEKEPAQ